MWLEAYLTGFPHAGLFTLVETYCLTPYVCQITNHTFCKLYYRLIVCESLFQNIKNKCGDFIYFLMQNEIFFLPFEDEITKSSAFKYILSR